MIGNPFTHLCPAVLYHGFSRRLESLNHGSGLHEKVVPGLIAAGFQCIYARDDLLQQDRNCFDIVGTRRDGHVDRWALSSTDSVCAVGFADCHFVADIV